MTPHKNFQEQEQLRSEKSDSERRSITRTKRYSATINLRFIISLIMVLIALTQFGCKKENQFAQQAGELAEQTRPKLSLNAAKEWYSKQNHPADSILKKLDLDWSKAKLTGKRKNLWAIPLSGSPIFQGIKQGKASLILYTDSSQNIEAKIIEVIPDAYTLQRTKKMDSNKFTGRILTYDRQYQFQTGRLIAAGKMVGEIKNKILEPEVLSGLRKSYSAALKESTEINYKLGKFSNYSNQNISSIIDIQPKSYSPLGAGSPSIPGYPDDNPSYGIPGQTSGLQEVCTWYDSFYFDAYGVFTIHSEKICIYVWVEEEENEWDDYYYLPGSGAPGGSTAPAPASDIPPPSNLPAEDQPSVNPQKMMDCFSAISTANASYQVKIHVQEPFPGTSFNIGPNSFGHVAVELTVTNGNQSITQVVGFYPTGSGLDKIISPGRIVNNANLEYNVSATYYVSQANFKNITDFIANPPADYHFLDYNCTAFAYQAATKGGIGLPMGYTTVGLSGPGGATFGQTPAGLGSELRQQKNNDPRLNISTGGGRARSSKGECN